MSDFVPVPQPRPEIDTAAAYPRRRIIFLRIPGGADDLLVEMPGTTPVKNWMGDLLRMADLPSGEGAYRLLRPDGALIPETLTLAQAGISNSDRLSLIPAGEVTPEMAAAAGALAQSAAAVIPVEIEAPAPVLQAAVQPPLSPAAPALLHPDGTVVDIPSLPAVIGRSGKDAKPDLDLASWDAGKLVSRRHAVILAAGEGFLLRAEKTTNGTFLNGAEIPPGTEHSLRDGDRIQFGYRGVEWIFRAGRA